MSLEGSFAYAAARAVAVLLSLAGVAAGGDLTGYEPMAKWHELPRDKTGITAGLACSYDRLGGNDDYNYYQWPTGFQTEDLDPVTILEIDGPGVLRRLHMPHACANRGYVFKVYVDDMLVVDSNSNDVLDGSSFAQSPLVTTLLGGQVSYEPICFQQSLKITSNNMQYPDAGYSGRHYYRYNYQLLPAGAAVCSYTGQLTGEQEAARAVAAAVVNGVGANPAGDDPAAVVLSEPAQSIPAGATLTLADLAGCGRIRRLNVKMSGATDDELDGLRLRVRYDGAVGNAIDVPVAHFFGAGHERAAYSSLPLGTESQDGFYCYWPMPFRRQAVVELYNATGSAISIDSAAVEHAEGGVSDKDGYLNARYDEQLLAPADRYYVMLQASGAGHYVGSLLYVERNGTSRRFLEGDEVITVDGSVLLHGNGLEDAYGGGFYYNHVLEQTNDGDQRDPESGTLPFNGLLHMDDEDHGDDFVRTDQYRWMIAEAVPFTQDIEVKVEHWSNDQDCLFGSTAFFYLLGGEAVPGDANFDEAVDGADYTVWADHYGMTEVCWSEGDFSGDAIVDGADYTAWADHYSPAAGTAAPEPAVLIPLTAGAALLRRRRLAKGSQ